jgi:hypothetical protein
VTGRSPAADRRSPGRRHCLRQRSDRPRRYRRHTTALSYRPGRRRRHRLRQLGCDGNRALTDTHDLGPATGADRQARGAATARGDRRQPDRWARSGRTGDGLSRVDGRADPPGSRLTSDGFPRRPDRDHRAFTKSGAGARSWPRPTPTRRTGSRRRRRRDTNALNHDRAVIRADGQAVGSPGRMMGKGDHLAELSDHDRPETGYQWQRYSSGSPGSGRRGSPSRLTVPRTRDNGIYALRQDERLSPAGQIHEHRARTSFQASSAEAARPDACVGSLPSA